MKPIPWFWVVRSAAAVLISMLVVLAYPHLTGWRLILAIVGASVGTSIVCDLWRSSYRRAQRDVIAGRKR